MNLVDKAEKTYRAAHKGYTPNIADLLVVDRAIGPLLGDRDRRLPERVGSNSQTYFAQVASSVISLIRARNGAKLITHSCIVLKSGSGVSCPTAGGEDDDDTAPRRRRRRRPRARARGSQPRGPTIGARCCSASPRSTGSS